MRDDDSEDEEDGGGAVGGRSGRVKVDDGPTAPDLQLDWVSSSDSDSDTDSCIEVVSVQRSGRGGRAVAVVDLTTESDDEVVLARPSPQTPPPAAHLPALPPPPPPPSSSGYRISWVPAAAPHVAGASAGVAPGPGPGPCRGHHPTEPGQPSTCSCARPPTTLGSIGLSASGAAGLSLEQHGAGCYGACVHPHHSAHHHHHHHHHHTLTPTPSHHHHHHHYYSPDSPLYYSALPAHPLFPPYPPTTLTSSSTYPAHPSLSRLNPIHQRIWQSQQRYQEMQRRCLDPRLSGPPPGTAQLTPHQTPTSQPPTSSAALTDQPPQTSTPSAPTPMDIQATSSTAPHSTHAPPHLHHHPSMDVLINTSHSHR